MQVKTIKKGDFLVARPVLNDYVFNRSVIIITEHNEKGSVGFILNKPLNQSINLYVSNLYTEAELYEGGPVEKNNIYYIHKRPDLIRDSEKISENLYWSGNYDDVRRALYSGTIKENEIRFYLGYSGWAEDQLENELQEKAWILMRDNVDIFKQWDNNLWKRQMQRLGGENLLWLNTPSDPSMN